MAIVKDLSGNSPISYGLDPRVPDPDLLIDQWVAVTLSDTVDLPTKPCRGLMATTAGAIKVTLLDGTTAVLSIAVGTVLRISATRVWSTGTTAAGVSAGY